MSLFLHIKNIRVNVARIVVIAKRHKRSKEKILKFLIVGASDLFRRNWAQLTSSWRQMR